MKSNFSKEEIRNKLQSFKPIKSEEQLIERDSMILQASYLSEIERLYQNIGLNRKDLAIKIGTSPSYLTQVFRGDKPLNFLTLAKIKRALDLRFDLVASFNSDKKDLDTNAFEVNSVEATKAFFKPTKNLDEPLKPEDKQYTQGKQNIALAPTAKSETIEHQIKSAGKKTKRGSELVRQPRSEKAEAKS